VTEKLKHEDINFIITMYSNHNNNLLCLNTYSKYVKCSSFTCKRQSNPITGPDRTRGFQKVEAPIFEDNGHMKVVRLSALRTGRLHPPLNIPGTHFC